MTACELCGSDEEFRTRLWERACLGCKVPGVHLICGICLSAWDLRLEPPGDGPCPDGRLRHLDCPDTARVAGILGDA